MNRRNFLLRFSLNYQLNYKKLKNSDKKFKCNHPNLHIGLQLWAGDSKLKHLKSDAEQRPLWSRYVTNDAKVVSTRCSEKRPRIAEKNSSKTGLANSLIFSVLKYFRLSIFVEHFMDILMRRNWYRQWFLFNILCKSKFPWNFIHYVQAT